MSFTDQQVMQEIQYVMLEPPNLGASWPSGMWTTSEVVGLIQQRQDRILKNTHAQVGIANVPTLQGVSQYTLPDDFIDTVMIMWMDGSLQPQELVKSDTWEADFGLPTWSYVQGTPKIYFDTATPTLIFTIAPIPNTNGTAVVYYVPNGGALSGSGDLMTVPDEMVPIVKYGVLADMFGKIGRANDPRVEYCNQRYDLGVEMVNMLLKGWQK